MDVTFVTQNKESFTIEIGYFDTVLEIKEKIEKYQNIPVSQQTLIFNNIVLDDCGNVESCFILNGSHIQLLTPSLQPNLSQQNHSTFNNSSRKIPIILNLPASKRKLGIDVDLNDSVEQLKRRIYQIEGFPASFITLHISRNIEMQDQRKLHEYELKHGSEIYVQKRLPSFPKLNITVVAMKGIELHMEVNPMDKIQVLRDKLKAMQEILVFDLAQDYFFIHDQNVLEENMTFRFYEVRDGDVIDIFNGIVTNGLHLPLQNGMG